MMERDNDAGPSLPEVAEADADAILTAPTNSLYPSPATQGETAYEMPEVQFGQSGRLQIL